MKKLLLFSFTIYSLTSCYKNVSQNVGSSDVVSQSPSKGLKQSNNFKPQTSSHDYATSVWVGSNLQLGNTTYVGPIGNYIHPISAIRGTAQLLPVNSHYSSDWFANFVSTVPTTGIQGYQKWGPIDADELLLKVNLENPPTQTGNVPSFDVDLTITGTTGTALLTFIGQSIKQKDDALTVNGVGITNSPALVRTFPSITTVQLQTLNNVLSTTIAGTQIASTNYTKLLGNLVSIGIQFKGPGLMNEVIVEDSGNNPDPTFRYMVTDFPDANTTWYYPFE